MPNLTAQEKKRLIRSINKNIGRTIFELFSPDDFSAFAKKAKITGPGYKKLKSYTLSKGLESSVYFMGYSKQIDLILEKTDLFLLPSETESFGLVALEAMAFGVPVISTSSGGLPELVIDSFNGFTAPVGDIKKMALDAINLLSNNNFYKEISFNASETAKKYDLKLIVSMYEECYKELMF